MKLILTRIDKREDGIFGTLHTETKTTLAVTIEHAYDSGLGNGSYDAKLQPGTYNCVRGAHQLHAGKPFETFEVKGVAGHTGILFHVGNFNEDSEGCILLGRRIAPRDPPESGNMITSSRNTFNAFMDLLRGLDSFTLEVRD